MYDGKVVAYTALIDQNTGGFNNETHDFQMIVAEDGSDEESTTYFFWVELV